VDWVSFHARLENTLPLGMLKLKVMQCGEKAGCLILGVSSPRPCSDIVVDRFLLAVLYLGDFRTYP
jgi:hypothetical protein